MFHPQFGASTVALQFPWAVYWLANTRPEDCRSFQATIDIYVKKITVIKGFDLNTKSWMLVLVCSLPMAAFTTQPQYPILQYYRHGHLFSSTGHHRDGMTCAFELGYMLEKQAGEMKKGVHDGKRLVVPLAPQFLQLFFFWQGLLPVPKEKEVERGLWEQAGETFATFLKHNFSSLDHHF